TQPSSNMNLANSTFIANKSNTAGGALLYGNSTNGSYEVNGNLFQSNQACLSICSIIEGGGAIYFGATANGTKIRLNTFSSNTATNGGAVVLSCIGCSVEKNIFSSNSALS